MSDRSDCVALLERAWRVASDLHGLRLTYEDDMGDVDLYDSILDFERRFPFAEIKDALSRKDRPS